MLHFRITASIVLFFICRVACAEETPSLIQPSKIQTSPWYLETGIRYWLGEGKYKQNLYDLSGSVLLSRLTYQDVTTHTAEGFWKLNHQNGVFFKGYIGGGSNTAGAFIDEDFPPALTVYSRTKSDQNDGRLNYFSVDLGYDLYQGEHYKISPFLGYHYWLTHYNGFGLTQTANIAANDSPQISNATDTLNYNTSWNSLRLGLNGEVQLSDRLNFVVDAAYIHAYLSERDFHNLRPDIRGMLDEGEGDGFQFDMAFNWLATPNLSMGIGARAWHVKAEGYSHFEETAAEGHPQYLDVTQNNYGLILQSQYRFDDSKNHLALIDKDGFNSNFKSWKGWFMGANIGYGMYPNNVYSLPFESTPDIIIENSPLLIHLQTSGFLGGGQVGYNWEQDSWVWGIESDINYASIAGTNSITYDNVLFFNDSVTQRLNWFGTVRAKIGKTSPHSTLLPYLTAGISFSNTELTHAQIIGSEFQETVTDKKTATHWVAGAGLEYAVSDHLSYKLEYLYLNLETPTLDTTYYNVSSNFASNVLRLGVNYYF